MPPGRAFFKAVSILIKHWEANMSIEVKVPALPESVSEATVAAWHKKPGERVARDENVVDLETDKVMLEVPAVTDGVLKEILKGEGETVGSGDIIAILVEGDGAGAQSEAQVRETSAQNGADEAKSEPAVETSEADAQAAQPLSPAVRRLVADYSLDATEIPASGKDGRLLKSDVVDYIENKGEAPERAPAQKPQEEQRGEARPATTPATQVDEGLPVGERVEERVPMTRIRARIAERLVQAQQTAAILTTFNEVDLFAVTQLREQYKERFEKENGIRLGFMSFFVKASVEALKRFPIVNASIDDRDIIYHGYYDIGIAVSSPRGLVVPIVRDADQLSFAGIEQKIREFGNKSRDNKLTMEELQGGTFSITNGGIFGSMLSTPILNPPQSAILGMHNIVKRPVVIGDEIKVRPVMYLALSYDHRIVDGRDAVSFLRTVKELLEDPARILLQV